MLVSGQDADLAAIERIFDGSQLRTAYKPVGDEARTAAEAAMKLARHEDVESRAQVPNGTLTTKAILLTPICVTQENAKQTVLKDWISEAGSGQARLAQRQTGWTHHNPDLGRGNSL